MNTLRTTLLVALLPANLLGAVVYNTFGPGDSVNPNSGVSAAWKIYGVGSSGNLGRAQAAQFSVPGGSYSLSSVTLSLGYVQDSTAMTISILADNAGSPSGPLIEMLTSDLSSVTNSQQVVTYASSLNPVMNAGNKFWLVVSPPGQNLLTSGDDSVFNWQNSTSFGKSASRSFDFQNGVWGAWDAYESTLLPAFRIEGTLIPEPASLWLLLCGLAILGVHRYRRHSSLHP